MKNYIIKPGVRGLFSYNPETEDLDYTDYMRTNIDWAYLVPEDGEVKFIEDGNTIVKSVKKNDVIIQFYKADGQKNRIIVVKSKEWKENIIGMAKAEEAKRLEATKEPCCCDDCENCVKCSDC